MEWEELIALFVDERVDAILKPYRPGRYSHAERKLMASLDAETREKFEISAVEQAEEEAKEYREVYKRAFLDGLYVGFWVLKEHERIGTEEK